MAGISNETPALPFFTRDSPPVPFITYRLQPLQRRMHLGQRYLVTPFQLRKPPELLLGLCRHAWSILVLKGARPANGDRPLAERGLHTGKVCGVVAAKP